MVWVKVQPLLLARLHSVGEGSIVMLSGICRRRL